MAEKLLNVEEAAEMLGRTLHGIYRLVERRQIPFRKDGRRVMFVESELEQHIANLPGTRLDDVIGQQYARR